MTTRKLNAIRKHSALSGYEQTFNSVLAYVEKAVNTDKYTAAQIAEIMDICKAQSEYGYNQCLQENI